MLFNRNQAEAALKWVSSALLATLLYFALEMRADIKTVTAKLDSIPVMENQIRTLEKETDRLRNKVFAFVDPHPAKREDEITLAKLLNLPL